MVGASASVLCAVLALVGCSGSSGKRQRATPRPSLTMSRSSTARQAASRGAVLAYRQMWSAFVAASRTSDPDAPDLRRYTQGQALKLIVSSLYTNRDQGKVTKGNVSLNPRVTAMTPHDDPTQVSVLDCVDSRHWLEYKASGGLWDREPGAKHRTTAVVKRSHGTWKVDSFVLTGGGTC